MRFPDLARSCHGLIEGHGHVKSGARRLLLAVYYVLCVTGATVTVLDIAPKGVPCLTTAEVLPFIWWCNQRKEGTRVLVYLCVWPTT